MAQIFPEWTNNLQTYSALAVVLLLAGAIGFFWYLGSPQYTDVGYRPDQPVPYSHKLHAGDLGIDCRYCHHNVEKWSVANLPPTQTCMNCHQLILPASDKLMPVRESWEIKAPIQWVRVHDLPDYSYFNHSIHLNAGVGCQSCHGDIAHMEKVTQVEPLSMGWCLDCHRNPAPHLRRSNQLTNTAWTPPEDQQDFAEQMIKEKQIAPPYECSGCHR